MSVPDDFRDELVRQLPNLRAFAVSLTGQTEYADDLVQDTIVKAWSKHEQFEPGTNLKAWLFRILRNEFLAAARKPKHEIEDPDGLHQNSLAEGPRQYDAMALDDFRRALNILPDEQREAIILVCASGFTYDEAADVCGVAPGTIKSRVSRARAILSEKLGLTAETEANAEDEGVLEFSAK